LPTLKRASFSRASIPANAGADALVPSTAVHESDITTAY
jgi:hypothetical protein